MCVGGRFDCVMVNGDGVFCAEMLVFRTLQVCPPSPLLVLVVDGATEAVCVCVYVCVNVF
jgi:hypothetical protein